MILPVRRNFFEITTCPNKYDPTFATSPICITDKDYDFSIDLEIITLVESDPFYGYESETVVAHVGKRCNFKKKSTHTQDHGDA